MRRPVRLFAKSLEERITPDTAPHNLAVSHFFQNWNDATLITANDNWSGVLSVVGYLGDDTFGEGVDPQTILTPYSTVDVIANQGSDTTLTTAGVAEFDGLAKRVIALQADETADAPNVVININTLRRSNISISYRLRDIDGTADNAITPVALQYRLGNAGNFVNVPAGFRSDVTTGPGKAGSGSLVDVTLPSSVDNQSLVQVRIITTNAVGNDEWVGIEDIFIGSKDLAINTYTSQGQRYSSVAVDADGDAFVVWQSLGQDGNGYGVYGQRFNALGVKVAGEFRINTFIPNDQVDPSVALDEDGNAMVVWQSSSQNNGFAGIYGQRFDSAGVKVGNEFQINTSGIGSLSSKSTPSVVMNAAGDAFVTYGSLSGISGQRLDAAGMKVGGEITINTYTAGPIGFPSVGIDADGNTVVVWQSYEQEGSFTFYDIYGQRLDWTGAKVGTEFHVNTFVDNSQELPSVAVDTDGDFVVVWQSDNQDGGGVSIFGQRFDSAGMKVGTEFLINTFTSNYQGNPSVAADANGVILVTWESHGQDDAATYGIYCQRYDAAGIKVGAESQVNTYTTNAQRYPSVAVDADGDAFVTWSSLNQDGISWGIYGQVFRSPNPPIKFSNLQINDGSAQRSMVTSLKINFDSPVTFAGSPSAAFSLVNQMTSNAAILSATLDPSGTAVTLTFTGGSVDLGGSLSDGRYTLTIFGNQFTGNGFDANGDGITGDNYLLVGTPANGLFRLFGDSDGNGTVNSTDFATFRTFFGVGPSIFDFNNDGQTNSDDFAEFRKRFGLMI